MELPSYNKPSLSVSDQIELLKSEGLSFRDENKARHILENVSLFRIKSYLRPLRISGQRTFKRNSFFEDAYSLYKFDSELRKIICSELEKIEISIRTQLSLIMGEESGIYWFEENDNFRMSSSHAKVLNNLKTEIMRSDDEAIAVFRTHYSNTFPPTWMTFEMSSFGTISMLYRCLKAGHAKRRVARFYGLSDKVLESWLHSIVYLRNICAHHSRLWNRKLSVNPLVPRKTKTPFITIPKDTKKVYYVMAIIAYLLQTIDPRNTFVKRIKQLLDKYPNVDIRAMGFPEMWEEETFWQAQTTPEEAVAYSESYLKELDNQSVLRFTAKKNREEGIEIGEAKERRKSIRMMLSFGVAAEQIAEQYGISAEEVRSIGESE